MELRATAKNVSRSTRTRLRLRRSKLPIIPLKSEMFKALKLKVLYLLNKVKVLYDLSANRIAAQIILFFIKPEILEKKNATSV